MSKQKSEIHEICGGYYKSGNKMNESIFKNNTITGEYKEYFDTSLLILSVFGHYKNGGKHGNWQWNYPNGETYVIGVYNNSLRTKEWKIYCNLPESRSSADAVVLIDKVYVIAGSTASGVHSNKVFAADLNASVAGVYDLYRKDGNASAGTPVVQAEVAAALQTQLPVQLACA